MVLKKRLKKLLIIALIVVTVVWTVALYLHIQAYNRYIQDSIERWIARGFDEDFVRGILDFTPFWIWQFGPALVVSALIIFEAWIGVIILTFQYMIRSHKRNNN
jgi:hypothetical protein